MNKKILILPGDYIGTEIMAEAVKVLEVLKVQRAGFPCRVNHLECWLTYRAIGGIANLKINFTDPNDPGLKPKLTEFLEWVFTAFPGFKETQAKYTGASWALRASGRADA